MGKIYLKKLYILAVTLLISLSTASFARAQSDCFLQNTFPSGELSKSQFGDCRPKDGNDCARYHAGLDLFYEPGHKVAIPQGCEVMLNAKGGYIFSQPQNNAVDDNNGNIVSPGNDKGYGYFVFLRCAEGSGEAVTTRYAHLNMPVKNGANQLLQGHSGSAGAGRGVEHYHYEVIIGDRPVDPECVLYGQKNDVNHESPSGQKPASPACRQCPAEIPPGPANLCDPNIVQALVQHGQLCTNNLTKGTPDGKTINPDKLRGIENDGTPDYEAPGDPDHDHEDGYEDSDEGGFTGDVDDIYPPIPVPDPELPIPPTPGVRGEEPNLVPEPEDSLMTPPMVETLVVTLEDGTEYFLCVDENPYDIIPDEHLDLMENYHFEDLPPDLLAEVDLFDTDGNGTLSGYECAPSVSDSDVTGPYLGPNDDGVIPIPTIPESDRFEIGKPDGTTTMVGYNPSPTARSRDTTTELSGCAADTWAAMVNQSVMQARREDMFNKHFIVKSDSVLDYSCFSEHVKKTHDLAGPIFSETMRWDNLIVDVLGEEDITIQLQTQEEDNDPFFSEKGYNFERDYTQSDGTTITYNLMSSNSLDVAIDSIVGQTAQAYLQGNFDHGYLAETTTTPGVNIATCNLADKLWKAEMCKNFGSPDLFDTLEYLTTNDPRQFPASMVCF